LKINNEPKLNEDNPSNVGHIMLGSKQVIISNCPVCGSDNLKVKFRVREPLAFRKGIYNIVECQNCGQMFLNPRLDNDLYKQIYDEFFAKPNFNKFWQILNNLKYIIDRKIPTRGGKLLDVGCGLGFFMKVKRDEGWEVFGVDIAKYATEFSRNTWNLNVKEGRLSEQKYPNDFFDVITMWQYFEHETDPIGILLETKRILKSGGLIVINVPNMDSLEVKVFKERTCYWSPPTHVFHYTPETLSRILEKTGFKVNKITFSFYSPQSFLFSFIHSLQLKLNKSIFPGYWKIYLSILLFPFFLPLNILASYLKIGSNMTIYATKPK